ncbi:unnamed protein product [Lepidochelys olivacea]
MVLPGQSMAAMLATSLELVLQSQGNGSYFKILELLQAAEDAAILCAIRPCSQFVALLELFGGQLLDQESSFTENCSAETKYKIGRRHCYNSCVNCLVELMGHESFQVKELSQPLWNWKGNTLQSR